MTGGHVLGDLLVPEDVISLLVDDTQWEQKLKEIPVQAWDGQKKKGGTKGIWIDAERDASLDDLTNSEPRVIQSDKKVTICSRDPSEQGTLQCLGCVKANIPVAKSYRCSPKCFLDAWQHDRVLHEHATSAVSENRNEEEKLFGHFNNTNTVLAGSQSTTTLSNGATAPLYPAAVAQRSDGETWFEVGRSRTYTPTVDDICHVLKFEYVVVDVETKQPVGHANTLLTSSVIPASSPNPRCLILVTGVDVTEHLDLDGHVSFEGTFTVLSYNILSDAYATSFPSWAYRRQNLLCEIVGYGADIVCHQEVE